MTTDRTSGGIPTWTARFTLDLHRGRDLRERFTLELPLLLSNPARTLIRSPLSSHPHISPPCLPVLVPLPKPLSAGHPSHNTVTRWSLVKTPPDPVKCQNGHGVDWVSG